MGILDSLPATAFVNVNDDDQTSELYRGSPVDWSADLKRIMALPRRVLNDTDPRAAVTWTRHLRKVRTEPCDCDQRWGVRDEAGKIIPGSGCITDLKPIQGWALEEVYDCKGMLGILGVGHGKTGLDILLPWALFPRKADKVHEAKVCLLLIPPKLKRRFFTKDYPQWAAHFEVPNLAGWTGTGFVMDGRPVLEVVSYSELSTKKNTDLMTRLRPDAIIADEAHKLKDRKAVRTSRFLKVFNQEYTVKTGKPTPYYCPMSGTITDHSIKEYAHHAQHALREGSPLPLAHPTLDEWAAAIDVSNHPAPMGRLRLLCEPGETVQEGFARRLLETKGVVTTSTASVKAALELAAIEVPPLPETITGHLRTIREEEKRPDGEESDGAMTTANWAREMASGFYSYWAFPKEYKRLCKCGAECTEACEAQKLIKAWFAARKNWNKSVRRKLYQAQEFADSPDLLKHAAMRWFDGYEHDGVKYPPKTPQRHVPATCPKCKTGQPDQNPHRKACVKCGREWPGGPLPTWDSVLDESEGTSQPIETWPEWAKLKDQVEPEPKTKWVDPFLINAAAEWGKKNVGVIWVGHADFGHRLAKAIGNGAPFYNGGGKDPELDEKGDRTIVCSIQAMNEGTNLQHLFYKNLVVHPPVAALLWEQFLGRTHRQGQRQDTVEADLYLHTAEFRRAFDTACRRAQYIQTTNRTPQKLCLATIDLTLAAEDA